MLYCRLDCGLLECVFGIRLPDWQGGREGEGRPQGGINAAVHDLGIDRTEAQCAVTIAAMPKRARETARTAGLDDNQSALLSVAAILEREYPTVTGAFLTYYCSDFARCLAGLTFFPGIRSERTSYDSGTASSSPKLTGASAIYRLCKTWAEAIWAIDLRAALHDQLGRYPARVGRANLG